MQISNEFANGIIADLIKVVYDGFGGASRLRCYLVGRTLLNNLINNFNLNLENLEMPEALKRVLEATKRAGIIGDADLSLNDPVLELKLHHCRFSAVPKKLKESSVPIFVCPCTNICLGLIEDKFGLDTEIMSITQEENKCKIKILLFK